MYWKCALLAALTTLGVPATTAPSAAADASHEKSYSVPGGVEFTVGQRDVASRPMAPLNGMPTNREVLLDTDFYGLISGSDSGVLKTGYYIACAMDLDPKAKLETKLQGEADLDLGVYIAPGEVSPSIDVSVSPNLSGAIGAELSMAPGKIVDVSVGEKKLTPGVLGTVASRDFHIHVSGCGGPLSIRAYARVTAESPAVNASGAIYGDPIAL